MQPWNHKGNCFSLHIYPFTHVLFKYGNGGYIKGIRWKWENKNPFQHIVCFSSKVLLTSSRRVVQLQVLYNLLPLPSPTHSSFVNPFKSSLLMIHSLLSPFNFFAIAIMESSTPNIFINVEAEHNGLCVDVGCVARCSNNNIVNKLKQEAPSNVATNDLIVQEVLLKYLRKQAKVWKPHHRTFHTRVFFKNQQ